MFDTYTVSTLIIYNSIANVVFALGRRQAKSRVFLMIKVAIKVIIVLQGRNYHFIFGGKISGRSNRIYDPRKVTWGSNF